MTLSNTDEYKQLLSVYEGRRMVFNDSVRDYREAPTDALRTRLESESHNLLRMSDRLGVLRGRIKAERGVKVRKPILHGTITGYDYYDCRCGDCTAAKNRFEFMEAR